MLKNIFLWILNIFKKKTETKPTEVEENQKYANDYERIDKINFNAIFGNKLANYVVNDSEINIMGENERANQFNKMSQSMWKKAKKIVSMGFGYGGVFLIPYIKNGKLHYNKVPQNRVTIDSTDGDVITGITVLADQKTITNNFTSKTYIRLASYKIENNNLVLEQAFVNEDGKQIPAPEFWQNIPLKIIISNVEKVIVGYIKSPINNRKANDKYGVPICYGCDDTIAEIRDCLKQIAREFKNKEAFIGADASMFNKNDKLAEDGVYKKVDSGKNDFWEIFSPEIRDSAYYNRLQELYKRLEHQVGTSAGILSDVETNNATATEIRKALYDTFSICDDMRTNFEEGINDFFEGCDILANAYNLIPQGDYQITYNWSYGLIEDAQAEWTQKTWAYSNNLEKDVEMRQWLHPSETLEESEKVIEEIKQSQVSIKDIMRTNDDDEE